MLDSRTQLVNKIVKVQKHTSKYHEQTSIKILIVDMHERTWHTVQAGFSFYTFLFKMTFDVTSHPNLMKERNFLILFYVTI